HLAHFERIRHKCAVLNNPADLAACSRGRSIRPALGLAHDHLVVGTVAQVCRRKGIDLLLDVARILLPEFPRLVFVIAGPVGHQEDAFAERMMQLAQDPAFDGRVRFLGPRGDVPDVLASTDVFFLPTRAEGFPVAVLEAMAAGLPVVASDVGGSAGVMPGPGLGRGVVAGAGEEQSGWPGRSGITLDNIEALPRLSRFVGALDVRATFFTTYQVATDPRAADILREIAAGGRAEIGAHLHPWNTPPVE